jgi:hypothetical protein
MQLMVTVWIAKIRTVARAITAMCKKKMMRMILIANSIYFGHSMQVQSIFLTGISNRFYDLDFRTVLKDEDAPQGHKFDRNLHVTLNS